MSASPAVSQAELAKALAVMTAYYMQQATASGSAQTPATAPASASVPRVPDTTNIFAQSPRLGGPVRESRTIGTKLTAGSIKEILERVMYAFYRDHPEIHISKERIYNAILNDSETQKMIFVRGDKEKIWIPIKTALASGRENGIYDHNKQKSSATAYRLNKEYYLKNRVRS